MAFLAYPKERGILPFTQDKLLQNISIHILIIFSFPTPVPLCHPLPSHWLLPSRTVLEKPDQPHQIFGICDCPSCHSNNSEWFYTTWSWQHGAATHCLSHPTADSLLNSSTAFMEGKKAGEGRSEEPGVFPFFIFFLNKCCPFPWLMDSPFIIQR